MINELDAWWTEHRTSARPLEDLLARAFDQIVAQPLIGRVYGRRHAARVRKLGVQGTPYAVYYRVHGERDEIVVLAVWSSMRRRGPPLG
ncbi:MAG: type II toxin-antitoxin system RelE/ParE family toxin [Polyangiaceae bacterium]|nr:type II toxin-antitoxin system RelE/ParE family toxin [Polyangiaceae bacterium]